MEGHCSTGQSPQWAVVPIEEEEIQGPSELRIDFCSSSHYVTYTSYRQIRRSGNWTSFRQEVFLLDPSIQANHYSNSWEWRNSFRATCVCFMIALLGKIPVYIECNYPATSHLNTGFSWFPSVYKQMLRWFPRFQVATTFESCSPPDLTLLWREKTNKMQKLDVYY